MRKAATYIILLLGTLLPARGVVEATYTLKGLTQYSDIIVLCDELNFRYNLIYTPQDPKWVGKETTAECKTVRIFKGNLEPGDTFLAKYGVGVRRQLYGRWHATSPKNIDKKDPRVFSGEYFPPGRALLFLRKNEKSGELMVITATLIYKNKAFGFFEDRYELTPQAPENIRLANPYKYGEDQLIKDLLIAMGKTPPPIYTSAPAPLKPAGANIIRSMHASIITTTGVITLLLLAAIAILLSHLKTDTRKTQPQTAPPPAPSAPPQTPAMSRSGNPPPPRPAAPPPAPAPTRRTANPGSAAA